MTVATGATGPVGSEMVHIVTTLGEERAAVSRRPVAPADIGEVPAVTLREDGHVGRTYEPTGPVLATPRDRIAAILGNPLPAEQRISPDVPQALGRAPHTFADRSTHAAGASR